MSALSSQGSTFTFNGQAYTVTSVTVDAPTPEIVNMTSGFDAKGYMVMVPTGDYTSPGRISVEGYGLFDPKPLVGVVGEAAFSTQHGVSVTRRAVCDSASADGQVGQLFRVRLTFLPTDYLDS